MKARRPLIRALWSVFLLSGSVITFYLVTRLFVLFFANGVNMMIIEERDTSLIFPAITLCNLNPLANVNMSQEHLMAYNEAMRTVRKRGNDFNIGHLFDPETLFANAGTYANNSIANQFLVACQWNMQPYGSRSCHAGDKQMHMYQARMGFCYTLTPPTSIDFVSGFSAILYLDNRLVLPVVPLYKLTINTPLSVGAYLFVHQRNTLPDLSKGTVLQAGRNSHVNIRVQQRIRQPHPYSNCTWEAILPQAPEYDYTHKSCLDLCFQISFIKTCGCIGTQAIYVPTLKGYNGEPLCGFIALSNMSQALKHFFEEQSCVHRVLLDPEHCDQQCHVACQETRYDLSTESTEWPHTALRLAFWREYIKNSTFSDRFESFREMWPHRHDTPNVTAWKLKQIENDDLLTRNFLQVILPLGINRLCHSIT